MDTNRTRNAACAFVAVGLIGCGARTGLALPHDRDAGSVADREIADTAQPEPDVRGKEEVCNGVDDDLDGRIDEGIPPIRCGLGVCQREIPGCIAGGVPVCVPGEPGPEVCNRLDDDCDGFVDEGLGFGEVAGPHVIRPANEGRAGDCSSCAWARDVALFDGPDGMLAVWSIGFDGSHPEPNSFYRVLNSDGEPTGDVEVLMDQNVLEAELLPATEGRALLSYCGRRGGDDYAMTRFVDGAGQLRSDPAVRFDRPGCGMAISLEPHAAGYVLGAGWGVPTPATYEIMDSDARSVEIFTLDVLDAAVPRFAVNDHALGMAFAAGPQWEDLVFGLLHHGGSSLSQSEWVSSDGVGFHGTLVATDGGRWVVFSGGDYREGMTRTWFNTEGKVVRGPDAFEPLIDVQEAGLARLQDGFVLWGYASTHDPWDSFLILWRLDGEGEVVDEWRMPERNFRRLPTVVIRGGRVFLLYATGGFESSVVKLREFGCVLPD